MVRVGKLLLELASIHSSAILVLGFTFAFRPCDSAFSLAVCIPDTFLATWNLNYKRSEKPLIQGAQVAQWCTEEGLLGNLDNRICGQGYLWSSSEHECTRNLQLSLANQLLKLHLVVEAKVGSVTVWMWHGPDCGYCMIDSGVPLVTFSQHHPDAIHSYFVWLEARNNISIEI
jgi:hypothetical protein